MGTSTTSPSPSATAADATMVGSIHPFVNHSQSICFVRKHHTYTHFMASCTCGMHGFVPWAIWFEMIRRKVHWETDILREKNYHFLHSMNVHKKNCAKITESVRILGNLTILFIYLVIDEYRQYDGRIVNMNWMQIGLTRRLISYKWKPFIC